MPTIKKINHIALVVEDIDSALGFWQSSLGIKVDHIEDIPQEKSRVAFLPIGMSEIELVQPTAGDSGVARYLEKRGPGMHHICLEVDHIQDMLVALKGRGIQLIHEIPLEHSDGYQYAFIHPKAANGVLVELYQKPLRTTVVFPRLETERLVLRQFKPSDAPAVFEMFALPEMNRFLNHEPMVSIEEAQRRVMDRIQLFERGLGCRWGITLKSDPGRVIGSCGYFSVRMNTQTVEIGFELHPNLWRRGIMMEALKALLEHGFTQSVPVPVHRIEALVDPENRGCIALLRSLGFQREGLRREFGYWKGSYQDVILFALLKNEWVGSG